MSNKPIEEKERELISHSPLKNKKRVLLKTRLNKNDEDEDEVMFSPTGVQIEKNINKKKIPKKKASNLENLSRNKKFKRLLETDRYYFNFQKLLQLEYDVTEFDPYRFIASLPAHEIVLKENKEKMQNFCIERKEKKEKKITLVLDLDETLVHCATYGMKKYDLVFPVVFNGIEYKVFVKKRPFFNEFLEFASKHFEVIVFTASHKTYANKLLDLIDKEGKIIKHRVFRDSCVIVDGNYLKDLTVLGRDLSTTVIVDNSPTAFGYHLANGIPILSWYEDEDDKELLKLIPFLKTLAKADDVKPKITNRFKFASIIDQYKNKINKERMF